MNGGENGGQDKDHHDHKADPGFGTAQERG